jgi:hypothetical protein
MHRLDLLRISLLASLTGCLSTLDDGESDGHTTTTMGTTAEAEGEGEGEAEGTGTGTGDGDVCELGCEGATMLADGIVQCPDGKLNRVGGGSFDPAINASSCQGNEDDLFCSSDADCNAGAHGKCIHREESFDIVTSWCSCVYSCASDDECSLGSVCLPTSVPGQPDWPICVAADDGCQTNSDCGECGECGIAAFDEGDCGYRYTLQCRTAADECTANEQCMGGSCVPDETGAWVCRFGSCDIGRPLLVDAVARTAPPRQRADWTARTHGFEQLREDPELAAHWAEIAALEHASVASFARFGAQLLALGAPPQLVRASKRAALDEIEHARLAYGLASAYGGTAIGPGQLELHGLSTSATWREVVAGLIEEACVGETLGVAEAMAAAESAREPAVRSVLERIAADELRHAQLAWRSLGWVLREADDADRAWAEALLERTIVAVAAANHSSGMHRPADGVLGGLARAGLHREASARVLAPLARALRVVDSHTPTVRS